MKTKEEILKEFDKRFYFSDGILCETIGNNGHSCNLDDIKDFVKYAITQTREETIREIREEMSKRLAERTVDGLLPLLELVDLEDILNKLKK